MQVYRNRGERPIHPRYVFPASTRAALHGLTMTVGARRVVAEIREREEARETFERARRDGQTATLLEQERPNQFTMSLANVMPGDRVEVELRYSERLVPTERVYEFVFPTVVGPRYPGAPRNETELAPLASGTVGLPVLPPGVDPEMRWEIDGTVASALPIRELESPSHAIDIARTDRALARVALRPGPEAAGRKDFILRYVLAGPSLQTGLSLYDHGDERFFALVVEPPRRVQPETIPAREIVFVVDVSGSMHGFPLDTAKGLVRRMVAGLRPQDRFNLLFFAGGSALLNPSSLPGSAENLERALAMLDAQRGGGGTELLPALQRALTLQPAGGISRHFVVVTDGYIGADDAVYELIVGLRGRANVHGFGIGTAVNRYLIESVARAGMGEPFVVTGPAEVDAVVDRFDRYVSAPVLTDVVLEAEGFDVYDVEPRTIPDVLAERPIVVQGKYRGDAKGALVLRGWSGKGAFEQRVAPATVEARPENEALRRLWARTRIAALSDFASAPTPAERAAIVSLGLQYHLLTRYTSFIAVLEEIRNPGGEGDDVAQPVPLPEGVSTLAVGMIRAPEPGFVGLLALGAAGAWMLRQRRRARALA